VDFRMHGRYVRTPYHSLARRPLYQDYSACNMVGVRACRALLMERPAHTCVLCVRADLSRTGDSGNQSSHYRGCPHKDCASHRSTDSTRRPTEYCSICEEAQTALDRGSST
jgi:hypothetical protein